jgi:membrane-associated phospholipid phosphatase
MKKGKSSAMTTAIYLTYYYPLVMALAFLACYFSTETAIPAKRRFFLRTLVALVIALLLAHLNRLFDFWPAHRYFASGHMTFAFGMALSLGMLRPWTLAFTLPLLIPFGAALITLHFHTPEDVLGAILIVLCVYGIIERVWKMSLVSPPLDRATVSS